MSLIGVRIPMNKEKELDELIDRIATSLTTSAEALNRLLHDMGSSSDDLESPLSTREVVQLLALTSVMTIPNGVLSNVNASDKKFAKFLDNHIKTLGKIRKLYDTRQE